MKISLEPLPYPENALEPHISAETLQYHYGKHHKSYVEKLKGQIEGTEFEELPVVDIIAKAREQAELGIFNNSAQAWNHEFLWNSMSPNGDTVPEGEILELVNEQFGDIDGFKKAFKDSAIGQFGSGWTWLVLDGSKLRIMSTANADTPVGTHLKPLLTLDVWEHAYYVDFRNDRAKYVDTFLEHLINWKFAAANLDEMRAAA